MEGEDLFTELTNLVLDFDIAILYSENGKIISVIGDDEIGFSKKLPDLCSVILSLGSNLTKNTDKGEYVYTIISLLDRKIMFYPYGNCCLIALLKETDGSYMFSKYFQALPQVSFSIFCVPRNTDLDVF